MKQEIMNAFGKVGFAIKKHSPEILAVVGVVGVVASAVMACKATTKVDDILEDHKEKMDEIHNNDEQDQPVKNAETTKVYAETGVKLVKLYAPAVTLGALSLGALLGSNQILRQRNSALAAAYMTVDSAFKKYRERVVDRFGEDVENQIFHNTTPTEVEETVTDEKGKEKKVKKTVNVADINDESCYVRYLTSTNTDYSENEEFVLTRLNMTQSYLNNRLKARGYLTLNEAYEAIGFNKSKAGLVVGWIFDRNNPVGDNYVQLKVTPVQALNEYGTYEKAYAIDFNVDGNIYNHMK